MGCGMRDEGQKVARLSMAAAMHRSKSPSQPISAFDVLAKLGSSTTASQLPPGWRQVTEANLACISAMACQSWPSAGVPRPQVTSGSRPRQIVKIGPVISTRKAGKAGMRPPAGRSARQAATASALRVSRRWVVAWPVARVMWERSVFTSRRGRVRAERWGRERSRRASLRAGRPSPPRPRPRASRRCTSSGSKQRCNARPPPPRGCPACLRRGSAPRSAARPSIGHRLCSDRPCRRSRYMHRH